MKFDIGIVLLVAATLNYHKNSVFRVVWYNTVRIAEEVRTLCAHCSFDDEIGRILKEPIVA